MAESDDIMNKAIFWDFDGTLAYSKSLWSSSVLRAIKSFLPDCSISLDDIRQYMNTGFTWHTPDEDFTHLVDNQWWNYMFDKFGNIYQTLGIDREISIKASRLTRDIIMETGNYTLYDDSITTLIGCIKAGYKNYILSNNYPELSEVIQRLNIHEYFTDYIISACIGYDKPRIELFDYAKKVAGFPDKCFMVGDSTSADIVGGKRAGMTTVLVHKNTDYDADYTFSELHELLKVI